MPNVSAFFDHATNTVTYLVSDPATRMAAIIDPVLDYEPNAALVATASIDTVLGVADREGLKVQWVLETHAHADHLTAAKVVAERTGAKIGIGARIVDVQRQFSPIFGLDGSATDASVFDHLFEDGDTFAIGNLSVDVLHTPGHTPACVSYLVDGSIFVGDTLFMPDFGTARTDFPGGSATALYRSVQRILALPAETKMFVGHDYLPPGRDHIQWETTVGEQQTQNIHVGGSVDEQAFVQLREARDQKLGVPKLILPSLQVNVRGGKLPDPEDDGIAYLRLPLNQLSGA